MSLDRPFLHGFFGAPNFGDELLCRSLLEAFPGRSGTIVATRRAAVTRRTAAGLRVTIVPGMLNNLPFFAWLPWRIAQLRRASHLLIGGGGLIQDTFGPVTMRRAAFDAAWALRFGLPFHIVGIEVNSLYRAEAKQLAAFVLRNAASVWCRDDQSVERARAAAGTERLVVRRMPDLAHETLGQWFASHAPQHPATGHCVVNPLTLPHARPAEFVRLVAALCLRYAKVTLAAAQPGEEAAWLRCLGTPPSNLELFVSGQWEPPLQLLASAKALIAERFHYIAAGTHAGVRLVPLTPTSKTAQLADDLGLRAQKLRPEHATAADILAALDRAQAVEPARRSVIRQDLRAAFDSIRQQLDKECTPITDSTLLESRQIIRSILRSGVRQKWDAAKGCLRRQK